MPNTIFFPFNILFSHSLVELAQTDTGEYLLGIVGEIASQDPCKISRVFGQNLSHIPSFVFAEVEYFVLQRISVLIVYNVALGVFYLFPNDASGEIYILVET